MHQQNGIKKVAGKMPATPARVCVLYLGRLCANYQNKCYHVDIQAVIFFV